MGKMWTNLWKLKVNHSVFQPSYALITWRIQSATKRNLRFIRYAKSIFEEKGICHRIRTVSTVISNRQEGVENRDKPEKCFFLSASLSAFFLSFFLYLTSPITDICCLECNTFKKYVSVSFIKTRSDPMSERG